MRLLGVLLLTLLACSGAEQVAECDLSAPNPTPCKNPMVLVPGLGASVLDVLYEDSYEALHKICEPGERNQWSSGIDRIWPSMADSFPDQVPGLREVKECRIRDLALSYDPETGLFSNAPGVQIKPRGWGCVNGISNLFRVKLGGRVLVHPTMSSVYERLIEYMTENLDYVVGQNLFGVPYDFRLVADQSYLDSYFADLKALIEQAYEKTASCESGPKRVFVASHSLGGPVLLYFLNTHVDAAWKQKYVRAFLAISSPWTGSPKAYRTLLSGDAEGMPGDNLQFLAAEGLMGGLLWMAPFREFHADKKFVAVAGQEYGLTEEDFKAVFADIAKRPDQAHLLNQVIAPRGKTVGDPGVLVACMYGTGLPTEAHFTYAGGSFDGDPVIDRHETGDGTVTLDVLEHCKEWEQVVSQEYEGGEHLNILHRDDFLEYATMLVTDCWSEPPADPPNPKCPEVSTSATPSGG